jgi:hypothetical protein
MAAFMIFVELKNASTEDYNKLNKALSYIHFYKVIKNITTEKFYVLPRSYYHYIGDVDNVEEMHSYVEYAIKKLFSNYTLLVIQSIGTIWSGFDEI